MAKKLKLTLVKSIIGLSPRQEATVKALGLRRIRHVVEHDDTPTIRGMIRKVVFAIEVEGRGAAEGEPSGSEVEGMPGAAVAGRGEPKASRADMGIEPSGSAVEGRGAAEGEPSGSRKKKAERSEAQS